MKDHSPHGNIFISYRRADNAAGYSRSMAQALRRTFGRRQVFRDIRSIPAGQDFSDYIQNELDSCKVMLVVIGNHWLSTTDAQGKRRLDDAGDWVRQEVSTALRKGIHVIPVLVCGATMPSAEELPAELAELAGRNSFEMTDVDWEHDLERLSATLGSLLGVAHPTASYRPGRPVERILDVVDAIRRTPHGYRPPTPSIARRTLSALGGLVKTVLVLGIIGLILVRNEGAAAWLDKAWSRTLEFVDQVTVSLSKP